MRLAPFLLALLLLAPLAAAGEKVPARILPVALPRPMNGSGSAWVPPGVLPACPDGCAFLAGGGTPNVPLATLVRVDPTGLRAVDEPARLAQPRWGAAAVWDGSGILVLGGYDGARHHDAIERYDPATGAMRTLGKLPRPVAYAAAFFDARERPGCPGGCAYLVGGAVQGGDSADVVQVDREGHVTTFAARLPQPRRDMGVAWDGARAHLIGGATGNATTDEVLRFDPSNLTFERAQARLPSPREYVGVAWNGSVALVMGGTAGARRFDDVLAYDPAADEVLDTGFVLPTARDGTGGAAWDGHRALLFGGHDARDLRLQDVVAVGAGAFTNATREPTPEPMRGPPDASPIPVPSVALAVAAAALVAWARRDR